MFIAEAVDVFAVRASLKCIVTRRDSILVDLKCAVRLFYLLTISTFIPARMLLDIHKNQCLNFPIPQILCRQPEMLPSSCHPCAVLRGSIPENVLVIVCYALRLCVVCLGLQTSSLSTGRAC